MATAGFKSCSACPPHTHANANYKKEQQQQQQQQQQQRKTAAEAAEAAAAAAADIERVLSSSGKEVIGI